MILVADSSALIALAICDGLYLLDELFGELMVPESVFKEVTKRDKPQAQVLCDFLKGNLHRLGNKTTDEMVANLDPIPLLRLSTMLNPPIFHS